MTDTFIPQTSASDRIEAARKALERFDKNQFWNDEAMARVLANALRALITPPAVGESEATIAGRLLDDYQSGETVYAALIAAVRAGIQSAHESWEPEVALRPTQEQMLRWLGIKYEDRPINSGNAIAIYQQTIERED